MWRRLKSPLTAYSHSFDAISKRSNYFAIAESEGIRIDRLDTFAMVQEKAVGDSNPIVSCRITPGSDVIFENLDPGTHGKWREKVHVVGDLPIGSP